MAGVSREQALSLLSAAKNRNDLAVKISSLKQARDILLSLEPSLASEIFPYLAELESSPESLVRKVLIELVEELGLKQLEHSFIFMPILLKFLKDDAPTVVRQSLICGTSFFCHVLEHVAMQFHQTGKVERWLEELWLWMLKLKDAVHQIALKSGSVATRLLAVKFLEISILLLTHEGSDFETSTRGGKRWNFSSAWLPGGHPALDHNLLMSEANRTIAILFDLLQSANTLRGSLTIVVINCVKAG